eukprot:4041927-Pyramimonas_sp.AAC.1
MAMQAEAEREAAVRRDHRESTRRCYQWLADAEAKPGVLYRIAEPPCRREEEIAREDAAIDCPVDIVDSKAAEFSEIWGSSDMPREKRAAIWRSREGRR